MKLEEKFIKLFNAYGLKETSKFYSEQCVDIADNYACEFGKWLRENDDDESTAMSDLLQIFYNEKGL